MGVPGILKNKKITVPAAILFFIVFAILISFQVSPWPAAMLIRYEFNKGGREISAALEKHVPSGVIARTNLSYNDSDKEALFDIFYPENTTKTLPTIVWVHGGGWVAGSKEDVANYMKILASHGYTVASLDYSIAPEKKYPTPLFQVNEAFKYLLMHASELFIDSQRIVLAGDSAGAQIASQVAVIVTNATYAQEIGIKPVLKPEQLRGVILACGAYDLNLPDYRGPAADFLRTVLWSYSGTKNFLKDPKMRHASVVNYVTAEFPPTFLTVGNGDPLQEHSKELARTLEKWGVSTTTLFFPQDLTPALPHEYQFNLDIPQGQEALKRILEFLKARFNARH